MFRAMQALSVLQVAGSKKSQPAIDRERRSSGFSQMADSNLLCSSFINFF